MKEITVAATIENILTVTDFVEAYLKSYACPPKAQTEINIAIDELFGNIAKYAYGAEGGQATVRIEKLENPTAVCITFIDNGMQYDPLSRPDPDTTLNLEDREIGGLGIYMVKKSMDAISYEYKNGKNILKITKNF